VAVRNCSPNHFRLFRRRAKIEDKRGVVPVTILALALAAGAAAGGPPTVGQPAPDFTLDDQNGHPVRLSDFRGKKGVVLAFYIRAFTPG
jgi:hypothetical protein